MNRPNFCYKCGRSLIDDAAFCPYCGAQVPQEGDPVEANAVFERIEDRDQDVEAKAVFETIGEFHPNTIHAVDEMPIKRSPLLEDVIKREKIYLEIPNKQGGGSYSCYVVCSQKPGESKKLWFENEAGKLVSDKFESGGYLQVHANTIVCVYPGSEGGTKRFILKYQSGRFSYLYDGPIADLKYNDQASGFIDRDAEYDYFFKDEPKSEHGFYLIDNTRILSIDTLCEYSFSREVIFKGLTGIKALGAAIAGGCLGYVVFAIVPFQVLDLFGVKNIDFLYYLGIVGAIIGIIVILKVNNSDRSICITYKLESLPRF